eukprot:RCo019415
MRRALQRPSCAGFRRASTAVKPYEGFEQGPTRPPTERFSLKLRTSRNCPWNQCTFCPLYKGERFSLRPVDHLKQDIDCIAGYVKKITTEGPEAVNLSQLQGPEKLAAEAALDWVKQGMKDVFLQDANTLLMNPKDLLEVLKYLRQIFPTMRRVTSYARSHTLARLADQDLRELKEAGLDRIHVGFESGCDAVLRRVRKGATQAIHVKGGQKAKRAGMELSMYVMPGLGGQELTHEHAVDSAETLNQVDPDFIRVRSLFLTPDMRLHQEMVQGLFQPLSEDGKVAELRLFVEHLKGITSLLRSSDHFLNLLAEVDGQFPEGKAEILSAIATYEGLPAEEKMLFKVGKRAALFRRLNDLRSPGMRARAQEVIAALGVTPDSADTVCRHFLGYFENALYRGGVFRFSPEVLAAVRESLRKESEEAAAGGVAATAQRLHGVGRTTVTPAEAVA